MSHARIKAEHYENLAGINVKASPYLTGPNESLDIRNFDFSVPGALTQRPGSTMAIGNTLAGKITGIHEYIRLDGFSQVIVGTTGAIWSGISPTLTSWSLGTSHGNLGASFFFDKGLWGNQTITYYFGGASITPSISYIKGSTQIPWFTTLRINPLIRKSNYLDFNTFTNWEILTSGDEFLKYNGTSCFLNEVPPVIMDLSSPGITLIGASAVVPGCSNFITKTSQQFFGSFINNRGARGTLGWLGGYDFTYIAGITTTISNADFSNGILNATGTTNAVMGVVVSTPPQFGLSGMDVYVASGITISDYLPNLSIGNIRYFTTMPVSTTLTTTFYLGSVGESALSSLPVLDPQLLDYFMLGASLVNGITTPALPINSYPLKNIVYHNLNNPLFSELHANRLFLAGFTLNPSDVAWSDITDFEVYDPSWRTEVRTNDGDIIRGLKSYANSLLIFKDHSTHELYGDAPENFGIRQISPDYGAINNRCAVTYLQKCWYLDRKGVVEYNGSNLGVVSTKVESFFNNVNWSVAKTEACMVHNKPRNEIWVGVPYGSGATLNNMTLIFDYVVNSWTIWDGFNPSYFSMVKQSDNLESAWYGDYVGRVNKFGASFLADNANGITCLLKTRYEHPEGQSIEKQFRRAFINCDSLSGATTFNISLNLTKNYDGSTYVVTQTIAQTKFQTYTNFGVSAKSLSMEMSHFSASNKIRLHGYVLEYRYQRRT